VAGEIILVLLILVLFYFIYVYNKIIKYKNTVREAWSGIDVQLRRRRNLIPLLSRVVSSYKDYERDTLQKVTEIRGRADNTDSPAEREKLEREFGKELMKIVALVENYPELKASEVYLQLQKELSEIEDNIQFARRYYNGAVRDYNTYISIFPNNIIAKLFGFKEEKFFELERAEEALTPKVDLGREK
jgi:LemA protein